jgi:hypothetical protein
MKQTGESNRFYSPGRAERIPGAVSILDSLNLVLRLNTDE